MVKCGEFLNEKEYLLNTPNIKRPMLNYFWNRNILAGVNQTGGGNGAYGRRALTYVDGEDKGKCSVIRDGNRYFYIQDAETGETFNPGWYPSRTPVEDYRCIHGLGYSFIESKHGGIKAGIRGFVNEEDPCEIWTVTITNMTNRVRKMNVFSFADFQLEGYERYSDYNSYVYADYDPSRNLLFLSNDAMEKPHPWYHAFMASSKKPATFDTSRDQFLGVYGNIQMPDAVAAGECRNSLAACEWMVGAMQHEFVMAANSSETYYILIGSADHKDTAISIADKLLFCKGAIEADFHELTKIKENLSERIRVETPDDKINHFANCWLKQQIQLCAEIGRDGCKGFRDQLQDAWAVASFNPKLARAKIIETLRYEYSNGKCERGWLPVTHHIYSDAPVWIPLTINAYIKETGDSSILEEVVPYLDQGCATVLEHMLVALRQSAQDLGEHGLVHALEGDWNDSLNMIGNGGIGESVWTSIALVWALQDMAELAKEILNDSLLEKEMLETQEKLSASINRFAWDGDWYLAAYNDQGRKVGSREEQEGRIYLNSQTWAILANVARGDRKEKCLAALDTLLDSEYGPLTLYPTYTKFNPQIGRLTSFVPGIWENGTPYCHGGTFKIVADCMSGRGDHAYESMRKILPDSEWNPSEASGCEPYALTNMYFGPDNKRKGETLFGWVTGTAGWMFRAITQYMLGFYPGHGTIRIDPCIPSSWKECSMKREFRGDLFTIRIQNPEGRNKGVKELLLDGNKLSGNEFPVPGDGREHEVIIVI